MEQRTETSSRPRGRPKQFSNEEILQKVMELFWEYGFKFLSFNEISAKTGLTRASLYNAFESKEKLFLAALDLYLQHAPDNKLMEIGPYDKVGPVLFDVFDEASALRAADEKHRGCFVTASTEELINDPSSIGDDMRALFEKRKDHLVKLMDQAIQNGELPADTNSHIYAQLILAFMSGYNMLSKSSATEEELVTLSHTFFLKMGFSKT